jgi:hypothetical protein
MATYTLRRNNETVTFTNEVKDGPVVIEDSADNMPYTVDATEGRTIWADYVRRGFKQNNTNVQPTATDSVVIPAPVVATSRPATQVERDVNRAMDSRRNGLARPSLNYGPEGKVRDMERVLRKLKSEGGLFILNYYIPVELSVSSGTRGQADYIPVRVENPASYFRGIGIHLDGSNWLMTKEALESDTVQDFLSTMDEYKDFIGGQGESPAYWDTHIREEEYQKFLTIAERKFMEYVRNLHTSLINCIGSADESLRTAQNSPEWASMTEKQRNTAEAYRNNRVRSRIKKADEELADAIKCAEAFDMTENLENLLAGLRAAIRSQRESFNAIAASRNIKVA